MAGCRAVLSLLHTTHESLIMPACKLPVEQHVGRGAAGSLLVLLKPVQGLLIRQPRSHVCNIHTPQAWMASCL